MLIEWVFLQGFRSFDEAKISLKESSLIIGANDVGKTNLLYAIRLLLDRHLSQADLDPAESDFHISSDAVQAETCQIILKLTEIDKEAVLSVLRGHVSDDKETFLKYVGDRQSLTHRLYIGATEDLYEEITSRFYTKYMNLRYAKSRRDLLTFAETEKKHLLRLSKESRTSEEATADEDQQESIRADLQKINNSVRDLSYVKSATDAINCELRELSVHNEDYEVRLDTGAIQASQFIDKLELAGGRTSGGRIGLGGDGRNNQILLALWKAKSEREHDLSNESIIYCIEEPEAHLHPQQQRKLSSFLTRNLVGQVVVTSHSPQVVAEFRPDSIVRLKSEDGRTTAASGGCSPCIDEAWTAFGYRMSILPAEAFFANGVLLVEGPSELLLYRRLAKTLDIDLDRHNLSILSVDGVGFNVYVSIIEAMEIPWVVRTDNDVFKVPRSDPPKYRFAGLNRALNLLNHDEYENVSEEDLACLEHSLEETRKLVEPDGVYIAQQDLENDLVSALPDECMKFSNTDSEAEAVAFFQEKKATRMFDFLSEHGAALEQLTDDPIVEPLRNLVRIISQ